MPQPTGTDIYVSEMLTDVAIAHGNAMGNYTHDDAMAIVPSDQQVSKYKTFTREDWLRIVAADRAPGTEGKGSGWGQAFESTNIGEVSVYKDIPYEDIENSRFDEEEIAANWCMEQIRMKTEQKLMAQILAAGSWASANQFTGIASGIPTALEFLQVDNPGSDVTSIVRDLCDFVGKIIGRRPNRMLFGSRAWTKATRNIAFRDDIKYTREGNMVSPENFAAAVEIEKVLVSRATNVTSQEGDATPTNAYIATENDAVLYYASPMADTKTPSAAYAFTFAPKKSMLARTNGFYVRRLDDPKPRNVRVQAGLYRQYKITSNVAGVHLASFCSASA